MKGVAVKWKRENGSSGYLTRIIILSSFADDAECPEEGLCREFGFGERSPSAVRKH